MAKPIAIWINRAGQKSNTYSLTLVQNSTDTDVLLYAEGDYAIVDVVFRYPDGRVSPKYHMIPKGYEADESDDGYDSKDQTALGTKQSGYWKWQFPIPFPVSSFAMPSASAKLDVSFSCYRRDSDGALYSPTVARTVIVVSGSASAETLDGSYNGTDVQNLWSAVGTNVGNISDLQANTLKKDQLVTNWQNPPLDTNIPSEALVKDSLDLKLDDSQLISDWASSATNNIPNASMTLTALNGKLDDSQLVTAWSNVPSNTNIPSEKLAKDTLDLKIDKSSIATAWGNNPSDTKVPSEKLTADSLAKKQDATAASIVATLGDTPVNRASADANGLNISSGYVKVSTKGVANGVATLDANAKIPLTQIPDSVLGQLLYAGTIASAGVCSLSSAFQSKYGISTLTISSNSANQYEGAYWIASASGSISAGTFAKIDYEVGDWIVSNGSNGYTKVDNTDLVMGVKGNAEADYRTGYVNITPANVGAIATADLDSTWANTNSDAKVPSEKLAYSTFVDHIGKLNQLDFTGTLSGDTITFVLTNSSDEITLIENNFVECDLHLAAAGTLSNATKMVIHYGAGASVINITNILNNTGTMLVGDMKQLEKYSSDTGFRWIFNCVYNTVSGNHFFGIPATVVREDILAMTDEELATHITNADLKRDQLVYIYSVGTGNGFYLGHTYKINDAVSTDTTATYPHVKTDATTTAVALTPVSGEEYRYGTISSLTLTLPTDIANHHSTIAFTSGATATTVSFPTGTRVIGMHVNSSGVFLPRSNTEYILSLRNDGNGNLCVMAAAL